MDHPVMYPAPLSNRLTPADFLRGNYDSGLATASQYEIGDIVTVRSGSVAKEVEAATAANITQLCVAGQPWDQGPLAASRYQWLRDRGVPLNLIIPYEDEWIFTLAGTLDAATLTAIRSGAQRDILYNATEKALTVRATSGSPAVKLKRVFKGAEGDTNARVVVTWLPGVLR